MIPESTEVRIEVSTRCNYNCIICPRDKFTRKKETMSFELFKYILDKIISETSQYRVLTLPGMGEPLLDDGIDEKIIYAREHGFKVLLLTNGARLTVEKFKRLEDIGIDSIRVSLYGNSPETYATIHGLKDLGAFQRIKENITEISRIKKTAEIILTYNVVAEYNESTLNSWIEFWKDKVDLLEVWRPHNWVDGKNYRIVSHDKLKTCGRPFNSPLQVQVDGTVNMCCFDFNGKLLLGDLKSQSLNEIFESDMFEKIVDCHEAGRFEGSGLICTSCDQRNSNKSDVMIYNSKYDIQERVNRVSTTYQDITVIPEHEIDHISVPKKV